MSWEALSAVVAVCAFLWAIVRQLVQLKNAQIEKAKAETKEKEKVEARFTALEREYKSMSERLGDHIKHTGEAIEALRSEMPNAIMNGVSRGFAKSLEEQRKLFAELQASAVKAPKRTTKPRTKKVQA